jgi:hypothetical protein
MSTNKPELEVETPNYMCKVEFEDDYVKSLALNRLSSVIKQINFVPPFNGPMTYRPLERICALKKEIIERDSNWLLADDITVLETQILNKIDNIDHTRPWNSDRNKLRYIDLFQTITRIRTLHPNWEIDLREARNSHLCRCHLCLAKRMLTADKNSDLENPVSEEDNKHFTP